MILPLFTNVFTSSLTGYDFQMIRITAVFSSILMLFAPYAVVAQQVTVDASLLQQLQQLLPQQSSSTVSTQLQQQLLNFMPVAQSYLQSLTPGDTEAIIQRLQASLTSPIMLNGFSFASSSAGTSTNQALIVTLLGQVSVLQQQINAILASSTATTTTLSATTTEGLLQEFPEPTLSVCPAVTRLLQFGMTGADVSGLQSFLITEGLLTNDSATGFFGKLTEAAVQAWQKTKEIVTEGDPATTGFGAVGPKTRAALQNCR
jgi:hypothetical protein